MKKLITTEGTKYAQNLKAFAIIDDKQTDGKPIMVDANVLEEAFENASEADKAAFEEVIHFDVEGEEIEVTPTTSQQIKTPSKGHNAITKATVNAVTSAIDANITAENIKKDVTILGVTGTYGSEEPFQDWTDGKYKRLYFKTNPADITLGSEAQSALDVLETSGSSAEMVKCFIKSDQTTLCALYTQFSTGSELTFSDLNLTYLFQKDDNVWSITEIKCINPHDDDSNIPGNSVEIVIKDDNGLEFNNDILKSEFPLDFLIRALIQVKESDKIEDPVL